MDVDYDYDYYCECVAKLLDDLCSVCGCGCGCVDVYVEISITYIWLGDMSIINSVFCSMCIVLMPQNPYLYHFVR